MDLKNTLAAVSLSAAIIVLWGLFFAPDADQVKKAQFQVVVVFAVVQFLW